MKKSIFRNRWPLDMFPPGMIDAIPKETWAAVAYLLARDEMTSRPQALRQILNACHILFEIESIPALNKKAAARWHHAIYLGKNPNPAKGGK